MCTCPNGTATVTNSIAETICETAGVVDCSACDSGYILTEADDEGSAQACEGEEIFTFAVSAPPSSLFDSHSC